MWYWVIGVLCFLAGAGITVLAYEIWGDVPHYVQNKVAPDGTVYPAGKWVTSKGE